MQSFTLTIFVFVVFYLDVCYTLDVDVIETIQRLSLNMLSANSYRMIISLQVLNNSKKYNPAQMVLLLITKLKVKLHKIFRHNFRVGLEVCVGLDLHFCYSSCIGTTNIGPAKQNCLA